MAINYKEVQAWARINAFYGKGSNVHDEDMADAMFTYASSLFCDELMKDAYKVAELEFQETKTPPQKVQDILRAMWDLDKYKTLRKTCEEKARRVVLRVPDETHIDYVSSYPPELLTCPCGSGKTRRDCCDLNTYKPESKGRSLICKTCSWSIAGEDTPEFFKSWILEHHNKGHKVAEYVLINGKDPVIPHEIEQVMQFTDLGRRCYMRDIGGPTYPISETLDDERQKLFRKAIDGKDLSFTFALAQEFADLSYKLHAQLLHEHYVKLVQEVSLKDNRLPEKTYKSIAEELRDEPAVARRLYEQALESLDINFLQACVWSLEEAGKLEYAKNLKGYRERLITNGVQVGDWQNQNTWGYSCTGCGRSATHSHTLDRACCIPTQEDSRVCLVEHARPGMKTRPGEFEMGTWVNKNTWKYECASCMSFGGVGFDQALWHCKCSKPFARPDMKDRPQ